MPYRPTLRIVAGDACNGDTPAALDQAGDRAQARGRPDQRVHRLAEGRVDRRDAHLVPDIRQNLCGRGGVVLTQIRRRNVLADADRPCNGLTDPARADDNDDVC